MSSNSKINGLTAGVIDFSAGFFGAIAGSIVGYPLDTIKLKVQTYPDRYKNSFMCFQKTLRKEGIKGFYQGGLASTWSAVVDKSILFCSYGFCQRMVCRLNSHKNISALDEAFAGSLAAFFSTFAICPTDLIKCRLQALSERGLRPGINTSQMIIKIIEEEGIIKHYKHLLISISTGIKGFYRGLDSTLARNMPGYFCYFGSYALAKDLLKSQENLGTLKMIIAGGLAGMCFWTSIFPFDVVKSRIQVESRDQYLLTELFNIIRNEGIRTLYKGLTPTLIRVFPASAALLVVYEKFKVLMTEVVENVI